MRKITLLTAGILCAASLATGVVASSVIKDIHAQVRPDFTIKIDGKTVKFKNADGEVIHPILYNGTTYLPIRAIGEMMNKTVYWYENDKLIELKEVKTTVTDADVIIGGSDTSADIVVSDKNNNTPDKNKETPDYSTFIGEASAKKIALQKANVSESNAIFKKTELDKDKGVWHYDVEFNIGRTEYDVEISATDGKVISFEVDND